MSKTLPRTILLKGRGYRLERIAAGTILPGHLLLLDSNNKVNVHNVAGGRALTVFAVESEHLQNDATGTASSIDTAYAANDFVQAEILGPGCEVNALLPANAAAIVVGDFLQSNGDGTLVKWASLADLTDSSGGSANTTLEAITALALSTAGGNTYSDTAVNTAVNTILAEIKNNFADLAARLNAMTPQGVGGPLMMALEAVDNSAVAAVARIQALVL